MHLFEHDLVYPGYLSWGTHLMDAFRDTFANGFDDNHLMVYGGPDRFNPDDLDTATAVAWLYYQIDDNGGILILPMVEGVSEGDMRDAYRGKRSTTASNINLASNTKRHIAASIGVDSLSEADIETCSNQLQASLVADDHSAPAFSDGERLFEDITKKIKQVYPTASVVCVKTFSDEHAANTGGATGMRPDDICMLLTELLTDARQVYIDISGPSRGASELPSFIWY